MRGEDEPTSDAEIWETRAGLADLSRAEGVPPRPAGAASRLRLVLVRGRPQGQSFLLPPGEYVIGRGRGCYPRPDGDWISRRHCLLRVSEADASVIDLGSRNGTLVNGSRVRGEVPLGHGDQVQVGPLVFEVRLD